MRSDRLASTRERTCTGDSRSNNAREKAHSWGTFIEIVENVANFGQEGLTRPTSGVPLVPYIACESHESIPLLQRVYKGL